jgi:hypothetical protein
MRASTCLGVFVECGTASAAPCARPRALVSEVVPPRSQAQLVLPFAVAGVCRFSACRQQVNSMEAPEGASAANAVRGMLAATACPFPTRAQALASHDELTVILRACPRSPTPPRARAASSLSRGCWTRRPAARTQSTRARASLRCTQRTTVPTTPARKRSTGGRIRFCAHGALILPESTSGVRISCRIKCVELRVVRKADRRRLSIALHAGITW